jgi:hypothetical protein
VGVLLSCGGGGSPSVPDTTPTSARAGWPVGTVVELVDGETGAPVAGQVVVAGVAVAAGAPLTSAAGVGATVDVTVDGFLPRQTSVRTGETRLVLWPDTPAFPGDYTKTLVYTDPGDGSIVTLRHLPSRVRTVAVSPSTELQADDGAMDVLRQAVEGIDAALVGQGVSYVLGGPGDFTVPVRVNPADTACTGTGRRATTWIWLGPAGEIQRAEVVACSASVARSVGTMTHELVHTFGLRHSSDPRDLMSGMYRSWRSTAPTPREGLAMALLLQRRPGTAWPDDDRNTRTASRRLEVIVD